MADKTPIRAVFTGSTATGLAEFQSGDTLGLTHGGLGASLSIGSAGQVIKVNSGASALEFGSVEAVFNIDGMTDGTSITIVDGDDFAISDGGTEKKVNASQIKTYISTSPTITGTATMADLDISGDVDVDGTLETDALSLNGTAVSSTAAELNALDGITAVVGELNALDIGSTAVGTAVASKAVILDSNKDYTGIRNLTLAGDLTVSGDDITMGTNTAGNLLVADGTNFNSIAVSSLSEISTAANDDVFIAIDTSGGGLKRIARSAVVAGLATDSAISNVVDDTSPQLGGNLDTNSANILIDDAHFIADESGNEQIIFQTTGSAVNQFDVTNAATGSGPQLSATGGDSNIDLNILAKGTGHVTVVGNTNAGAIQFNCESNTHGQILKSQPHSATVTNVMLLPAGADSTLVSLVSTDTLTNKTLTSPKINEDVAITSTATELNKMDGNTSATSTTVADADRVVMNDNGTMVQVAMTDVSTYIGGGITVADQWRITSDFGMADSTAEFLTANWETVDAGGQGTLGSAMTESSGVFTFPSTGIYLVSFAALFQGENGDGDSRKTYATIHVTTDNSSYAEIALGSQTMEDRGADFDATAPVSSLIDVTNTTNVKVKFNVFAQQSGYASRGHTSVNMTYATFTRLGAT